MDCGWQRARRREDRGMVVGGVPRDDAEPLDWLLFEQSAVLTYRQAVDLLGPGRVRHLTSSGRWRSIGRGLLLAGPGRLDRDQQLWVAVLAAGRGAVLAGPTAVCEAGVRGARRDPIHLLVPAQRMVSRLLPGLPIDMPAVRVHRTSVLPDGHLQRGRPPRTTLARAVIDAAAWATGDDEAVTVLAAACQQRKVTPAELHEVVSTLPRTRRRSLIRSTLDDVAGGAEALSEIDFVRLCRRFGLPEPDLQHRRRDATGRLRYLDAYWRRWRLHVEVDGAHHLDVRHWAADMQRQNDIWISGDRILRFPAHHIRAHPTRVATQLRTALAAAGWQGLDGSR